MTSFASKHLPNLCALGLILITLFVFVFRLVATQTERDAKSDSIRAIESNSAALKKEIEILRAQKESLCNAAQLRNSVLLPKNLEEVPNEKIIRVRTRSIPYGTGQQSSSIGSRTLAVELTELAAANTKH